MEAQSQTERREASDGNGGLTRRRFLCGVAATAGMGWLPSARAGSGRDRLTLPPNTPPAEVVVVKSEHVFANDSVHTVLLAELLGNLLMTLTGTGNERQAWQAVLRPDDVIGLKFNQSGQSVLGTTPAVADALIRSLIVAGWPTEQIVCIEAPAETLACHRTQAAWTGYDSAPTDFGSGSDHFALVLRQITALIDVAFLKSHNIAGMTGCLKNLSHGLVQHPARYHGNGCAPYIGDIVAAEPIRSKLRLCVVDGLRVPYAGGPTPRPEATTNAGLLMVAKDPVAADSVGLGILNGIRRERELEPIARSAEHLPYLAGAHRAGVGIALPAGIRVTRLSG